MLLQIWKFVFFLIISWNYIALGVIAGQVLNQKHNHNLNLGLNSSVRYDGKIIISSSGVPCLSECERASGTYGLSCDIGGSRTQYCSHRTGDDYTGRSCRDAHPCGFHGTEYMWCFVDANNNTGYCGLVLDELDPQNQTHLTYSGQACKSPCVKRDSAAAECFVFIGSDGEGAILDVFHSCSMEPETTDTGVACRKGSSCDFHGYNYQWCWVGEETSTDWGYCGQVLNNETDVALTYYTYYGEKCQSTCFDSGISYYWCWEDGNAQVWNYCSRKQDETIRGQPCMKYHNCGKHGYSYYWCYLEDKSWDYCSVPENRKVDKAGLKIRSFHQSNLVTEKIHMPHNLRNESKIRRQKWVGKSYFLEISAKMN